MKNRTARTLGDTPGAQLKLLQRIAERADRESRLNLMKCQPRTGRVRRWIAAAFGF